MGMIGDEEEEEEILKKERQRQQLQEQLLVLQSMMAFEKSPARPVVSLFGYTRSRSSVCSNIGLVFLRSHWFLLRDCTPPTKFTQHICDPSNELRFNSLTLSLSPLHHHFQGLGESEEAIKYASEKCKRGNSSLVFRVSSQLLFQFPPSVFNV